MKNPVSVLQVLQEEYKVSLKSGQGEKKKKEEAGVFSCHKKGDEKKFHPPFAF
jgi:hypothetical protein